MNTFFSQIKRARSLQEQPKLLHPRSDLFRIWFSCKTSHHAAGDTDCSVVGEDGVEVMSFDRGVTSVSQSREFESPAEDPVQRKLPFRGYPETVCCTVRSGPGCMFRCEPRKISKFTQGTGK